MGHYSDYDPYEQTTASEVEETIRYWAEEADVNNDLREFDMRYSDGALDIVIDADGSIFPLGDMLANGSVRLLRVEGEVRVRLTDFADVYDLDEPDA